MKNKEKEVKNPRLGTVGGSAVIEGVMMKNRDHYAVSVRLEDGSIRTLVDDCVSVRKKHKILNLPIIRGVVNFVEQMILSYRTLSISADAYGLDEEAEESRFEKWLREKLGASIMDVVMVIATVLGLALGFGLFFFLPILLTKFVDGLAEGSLGWFKNLIEGLIKIAIFLGYLAAVSAMPDIRRTFEYHGAEHKSIFCYESGEELTPENAAKFKRFHPRCGTSFIFVILAISILINSLPFVTWDNALLRMATKLLLLPVIVGIGYEFLMFAGKHDNALTRVLSAPGLWMQRLTTREPDLAQLEIAISALKAALPDVFPTEEPYQTVAEYSAGSAKTDNAEISDNADNSEEQTVSAKYSDSENTTAADR